MRIAKLFFFILIFWACEPRSNIAIRTSVDLGIVEVDTLTLRSTNSGTVWKYLIGTDELEYNIDFSTPSKSTFSRNSREQSFYLSDTTTFYLNTSKLKVYRFNSNSEVIDGEQFHFLTAEHGVLMIRSSSWGNSTILELWSYPILERMSIFRHEEPEISKSYIELIEDLEIETTER